jgi:hypothetical protein
MPFPAPFGEDFPNLERGLSENIPVLCGLLVGFAGLLFVTVATLSDIDKSLHIVDYRPLVLLGPTLVNIAGKVFLLWLSGVACLFFYLAVVSIIYARMSQYRDLVSESELVRLRTQEPLVVEEEQRLNRRRNRYVTSCMILFNCAIISLPVSLLPLIVEKRWVQSLVIDVSILFLVYTFWAMRKRLLQLIV